MPLSGKTEYSVRPGRLAGSLVLLFFLVTPGCTTAYQYQEPNLAGEQVAVVQAAGGLVIRAVDGTYTGSRTSVRVLPGWRAIVVYRGFFRGNAIASFEANAGHAYEIRESTGPSVFIEVVDKTTGELVVGATPSAH